MKKNISYLSSALSPDVFYRPAVATLIILILGALVYSSTLSVPFYLDDKTSIVINPDIKDINNFTDLSAFAGNRVIGKLTFALNYAMHGLDVTGYHIFNITVHIINALLVYWLVLQIFRTPFFSKAAHGHEIFPSTDSDFSDRLAGFLALFSAMLFVVHPVQTQAVTYICQRYASLTTMFYLLAVVSYSVSRNALVPTKRIIGYAVSLLSVILAMKTKEIAFTLPFIIILYECIFFPGTAKTRILRTLPFLLTLLIIPLSLAGTQDVATALISRADEATRLGTDLPRLDYVFTQCRVIVTYIRLLFFPINQMLDYDYPIYRSFLDPDVFFSFFLLLVLVVLAVVGIVASRKKYRILRLISFGIVWFLLTLSVESSVIPIADVIFEHRLYLPSVGFVLSITSTLILCGALLAGKIYSVRSGITMIFLLLAIYISALGVAAYKRNEIWVRPIMFWEDALRKSPRKARSYCCLGAAYVNIGRFDKAIALCETAVALKPDYLYGRINLGFAYYCSGFIDKAIEHYLAALQLNPNSAEAHLNLSLAYKKKGLFEKAAEHERLAKTINRDIFRDKRHSSSN